MEPQILLEHWLDKPLHDRFQQALKRNTHLDANELLSRALGTYLNEMEN